MNKNRLRLATTLHCIIAAISNLVTGYKSKNCCNASLRYLGKLALGQADSPSSYCRSWYRLVDSSTVNGGHSCPWQNGGPSRTVGRPSTFKLISLLAEVPVTTAVQNIASHTCDIVVNLMLSYGLLARKALRRARPRYQQVMFRNQITESESDQSSSTKLPITKRQCSGKIVLANHFRNPTDDGHNRKPFQDIANPVFRGRSD